MGGIFVAKVVANFLPLLQYTMTSRFFDHFAMYLDQKESCVSTSLIVHSLIINKDWRERLGWVQALQQKTSRFFRHCCNTS
jgi:hypothetical protein